METYKTAPPLIPAVQQQSHREFLSTIQVEEATKMGITNMTTKNTQYDLLKRIKFQKDRLRVTSKRVRHLAKLHGRKKAKSMLKQNLLLN